MIKTKTLKGGTFNLLYGRDDKIVITEIEGLLLKHDLDFLCLQEAYNYTKALTQISGYTLIYNPETWGGRESVILVKEGHKIDRIAFFEYGNGWFTTKGNHHPATGQSQVRIDGWLIVRSLHLPTPSDWKNGELGGRTPIRRKDDLIAAMEGLQEFFTPRCIYNARAAVGDWNEPPFTTGMYSPMWLQERTGAVAKHTESKAGHGHIDYPMVKGAEIVDIWKDVWSIEASDHEPVIFVLKKLNLLDRLRRKRRRR